MGFSKLVLFKIRKGYLKIARGVLTQFEPLVGKHLDIFPST